MTAIDDARAKDAAFVHADCGGIDPCEGCGHSVIVFHDGIERACFHVDEDHDRAIFHQVEGYDWKRHRLGEDQRGFAVYANVSMSKTCCPCVGGRTPRTGSELNESIGSPGTEAA